jgi:hypothetical protein
MKRMCLVVNILARGSTRALRRNAAQEVAYLVAPIKGAGSFLDSFLSSHSAKATLEEMNQKGLIPIFWLRIPRIWALFGHFEI